MHTERKMVMLGYRHDEIQELARITEIKRGMTIHEAKIVAPVERKVVASSLGPICFGAALPRADPTDPETLRAGAAARMGKVLPKGKETFRERIRESTRKWVYEESGLKPLSWEKDWSFDHYIESVPWPKWKKDELIKSREEILDPLERNARDTLIHAVIKMHPKNEGFIGFKHLRLIYARQAPFKAFWGRNFRYFETPLYKHPAFIKHVPVKDRAKYIYDYLYQEGWSYVATDYSSFESHFTKEMMLDCEFILYEYMMSEMPNGAAIIAAMKEVLTGVNHCENKFFGLEVEACRMSGEMNTSLGNGFSNLMWMTLVCRDMGVPCVGVVEGDDGLFGFADETPTTKIFDEMGAIIKLEVHTKISNASFCGLLFDETDLEIITDPFDVVCSFGWIGPEYTKCKKNKQLGLLRCKALSLRHQYPACPIVTSLSNYGLRVTRSHTIDRMILKRKDLCMWERDQLVAAMNDKLVMEEREIGIETRLLVNEIYGVSVEEQLLIEAYLDGLTDVAPLHIPIISENCPASWRVFWDDYVCDVASSSIEAGMIKDWITPVHPRSFDNRLPARNYVRV
jgi:hypothetical protein